MNINDQMQELATMGGRAYAADDDLVASLLSRTKRARATRKSASVMAGTVGALALGLVAAQVYAATKNDPAFRDRNLINNNDNLTPIELYRAKYGKDTPTRNVDSAVDLTSIIDKLKAAAQAPQAPGPSTEKPPSTTTTTTKPPATTTKPPKDEGGGSTCTPPESMPGATWDCTESKWIPNVGYFMFGNGHVYQNIQWTDAATGVTSWGNWSGTSWGWEKKAIFTDGSSDTYTDTYQYMGGYASWSGTTCAGVTKKWDNAKFKASCLRSDRVPGGIATSNYDGIEWVLIDTHMKWHDVNCQYEDPANPPAGWMWDGSQWVEVTT